MALWLAMPWNSRPFCKAGSSTRLKLEQLNKKDVYTYTAKSVKGMKMRGLGVWPY
jgi:hypothetical protein